MGIKGYSTIVELVIHNCRERLLTKGESFYFDGFGFFFD